MLEEVAKEFGFELSEEEKIVAAEFLEQNELSAAPLWGRQY